MTSNMEENVKWRIINIFINGCPKVNGNLSLGIMVNKIQKI